VNELAEEDEVDGPHDIFKVDLKNGGGVYVLDMAGAQFGYYDESIAPWSEYCKLRVSTIISAKPLGTMKQHLEERAHGIGGMFRDLTAYLLTTHGQLALRLEGGTKNWEEKNESTVRAMLKMPQKGFENRSKKLVEYIRVDLKNQWDLIKDDEARNSAGGVKELARVYSTLTSSWWIDIDAGGCSSGTCLSYPWTQKQTPNKMQSERSPVQES